MIAELGALAAVAAAFFLRAVFIRRRGAERVDEYYWRLIARAARLNRRPPYVLPGKYLLEEENQYYPPLFGFVLSFVPERWIAARGPWLSHLPDALLIVAALAVLPSAGVGAARIAAFVAVLVLAPAWTVYSAQLNPRSFGNLFFSAAMILQVLAAGAPDTGAAAALWAGAAVSAALVVLSHKMTTQLMLVLWPFWAWALGAWEAALIPPAGIFIAALVTGPRFAARQWQAHADIVSFWHRHWRELGLHGFRHSPVYGDPAAGRSGAYHQPGLAGARSHLVTIAGYAPFNLALVPLLIAGNGLPAWLWIWFGGTYAWAGLTLFVPALKCFGGGHLYAANAVVPGAIAWGFVLGSPTPAVFALFAAGAGLTMVALWVAWVRGRDRDPATRHAIEALIAALPTEPARIAAFPLAAIEEIAFKTPHAVLWGAHSYGFDRLTPVFPVVTRQLSETLLRYRVDWLAWDEAYWPGGTDAVKNENISDESPQRFGDWRLVRVKR